MSFNIIRERWSDLLIGPDTGNLATVESIHLLDEKIRSILDSTNDGIQLKFNGPELWNWSKTLRLVAIGLRTSKSKYYESEKALQFILLGLKQLYEAGYDENMVSTGNWWEWTIGLPTSITDTMLLLADRLPPILQNSLRATIRHNIPDPKYNRWSRTKGNQHMTSTNLLDQIQPLLILACIDEDESVVRSLLSLVIESAAFVESGEGLYRDGSFIFHVNKPYNGTYGAVFFNSLLKFSYAFQYSNFSLEEDVRYFMRVFCEKGLLPLVMGRQYAAIVCGRAAHRPSRLSDSVQNIIDLLIYNVMTHQQIEPLALFANNIVENSETILLDSYSPEEDNSPASISGWITYNRSQLAVMSQARNSTNEALQSSMTWYPKMLRGIFRSEHGWTVEMALADRSIAFFEYGSSENQYGYHSGNGAYWLHPVDSTHIPAFLGVEPFGVPGSTVDLGIEFSPGTPWSSNAPSNSWAGALGHGLQQSVLSLDMFGYQSKVRAFKSWFLFPDYIVYMASNIRYHSGVARSVIFSTSNPDQYIFERIDSYTIRIVGWGLVESTGSYLNLSVKDNNENNFATIYVDHRLPNETFTVLIFPDVNQNRSALRSTILPTLENVSSSGITLHAVTDSRGAFWAVAQQGSEFRLGEFSVKVSRGCILSIKPTDETLEVSVADPSDQGLDFQMRITSVTETKMEPVSLLFPNLGRSEETKFVSVIFGSQRPKIT